MEQSESAEESYLAIEMNTLTFVVPLQEVEHILSGGAEMVNDAECCHTPDGEKLPLINGGVRLGRNQYHIISLRVDDRRVGLVVDSVVGVAHIAPQDQFPLPRLACAAQNSYLGGVSYWPEQRKLCYLLDAHSCAQYAKE